MSNSFQPIIESGAHLVTLKENGINNGSLYLAREKNGIHIIDLK